MGIRYRMVDLLYEAEYSPSEPFEVDFFGLRYLGNLNCYLDWNVYFFGAAAKQTLFLLRDLIASKPDSVFVDVGANVGEFTLFMSRFASHVHAFEPWETVRSAMSRNIERNSLTNIKVHPVGLGEKDESLLFYAPLGANTGTGSFSPAHATDRNRPLRKLEVRKGDDYFKSQGISRVDLLKIDVEGWERYVLSGLRSTLALLKPVVLMEVSETTLASFGSLDGFRQCIPSDYCAYSVEFGRRGTRYLPFDGKRAGEVLLRVP